MPGLPPMVHEAATLVAETPAPRKMIGVARMEKDGTIVMWLRVEHGMGIGDAELKYAPDDPDYARVRAHLPDLAPGKEVPVYNDWD